jgi:polar amino acid transport system substrate-binding protein
MTASFPSRRPFVAAAAAALTLTLAACGGGGDETEAETTAAAPQPTADSALAEQVPEEIKADGKITVGVDATYAPNEYLEEDGKTVTGFDVAVFDAVAAKLGLETEYIPAPFDNIIPGVIQAGEYEIGVSSFTINEERKQQATMVSYFEAGTQWGTQKGNPANVDPNNACGKKVAVQRGTVQVDDVTARSDKCVAEGKPAITIDQYQGQDQATAAVVSGKDDAMLADSPVLAWAVKQTNGQLELLGDIYDSAPYGYVIRKDQQPFAEAIVGGLKAIIADGTYMKALEEWGVEQGAITEPQINP